jgi:Peptidase inhibitor family I36
MKAIFERSGPAQRAWRVQRVAVSLAAVAALALTIAPAHAGETGAPSQNVQVAAELSRQARTMPELQRQIALQLRVAPGGTQTAVNEVSYDGGRFVVTYALPGQRVAGSPDCPSDWFCFYDNPDYGYPRGKLSDYGWQDLYRWRWHDRTESVDNSTNSAVDFDNHTSGGHANDVFLFCVSRFSSNPRTSHPNTADHVDRATRKLYC